MGPPCWRRTWISPLQDEHHLLGRRAFFKQDFAGAGDELGAVAG
jgi:hypothetical protein